MKAGKPAAIAKWERKVIHKQNRICAKIELDKAVLEYFEMK